MLLANATLRAFRALLGWEQETAKFKGTNISIAATNRRISPPASCSAFTIDANPRPVPVQLVRDIHIPALSETVVEVKSDEAPALTTAAVVESHIHTSDDESPDPLSPVWEHGLVAHTAYTWAASDCSAIVQPA